MIGPKTASESDRLGKPFSYPELLARIGALLRRGDARRAPRVLRAGDLTIDVAERTAASRRAPPGAARQGIRAAAHARGRTTRVFTREELLRIVWGQACGTSRSLDSHACRLRRRLVDAGAHGVLINVWGVGYRLVDPIQAS